MLISRGGNCSLPPGSGDVGNSVEYSTMPEYSVAIMLSSLVECAVDDEDRDEEEEEASPDVLKTEKYANRNPSLLSSENGKLSSSTVKN